MIRSAVHVCGCRLRASPRLSAWQRPASSAALLRQQLQQEQQQQRQRQAPIFEDDPADRPAPKPFRPRVTVVQHRPADGSPAAPAVPDECEPLFAIMKLGATQYKVTVEDVIAAEKIKGVDIGEHIDIKDVLLVGTRHKTLIGQPVVPKARVQLLLEEHTQDEKITIFKKRRRKSSRRTQGFRREVTILRVLAIKCEGVTDKDGNLLES